MDYLYILYLELVPLTMFHNTLIVTTTPGRFEANAMGTENRWRIRVETERILIITRRHATRGWCEKCGQEVELLTAKRAESVFAISFDQIETQTLSDFHLGRAKEGLVICLKSLLRLVQSAIFEDGPGNRFVGGNRQ